MPCAFHGNSHMSRRSLLQGAGAAGLVALAGPAAARLFPDGEFNSRLLALFEKAGGEAIGRAMPFTLTGTDMPWTQQLFEVKAGQKITFLLSGRWHLMRTLDLWFEPGVVFHARVSGGAMFNPMDNSGTMQADRDGLVEIARSAGEFATPAGDLWGPAEEYVKAEGRVEGIAIVWNITPETGLRRMLAEGDAGLVIHDALQRETFPHATPEGWHNHHNFGEAGIFRTSGDEMCCQTHKNVAILRRDVEMDLVDGLTLTWDWLVEELPSRVAEDHVPTHDYLSIAVEYDDGQDITYMWSAELSQGTVFRCPLPGWNMIETHVVQRSGRDELGQWLSESRNLMADYRDIIGGKATKVRRVWLIGTSVFQRQSGLCRYRNVSIGADSARLELT